MDASERILIGLCAVFVLGTSAQWIAWRLRLPSILLLLSFGFIAGPVSGWLRPQDLVGGLQVPGVAAAGGASRFEWR